jgi:hypothetical protein
MPSLVVELIVARRHEIVAWLSLIGLVVVDRARACLQCVTIKAALLLTIEDCAWRADEYVVARASANVIDIAPVVVAIHDLLRFLLAGELGWKFACYVIAVKHKCAVRFGLGS